MGATEKPNNWLPGERGGGRRGGWGVGQGGGQGGVDGGGTRDQCGSNKAFTGSTFWAP